MELEKQMAYQFEERYNKELEFWNSHKGKELELCLVSQGYGYRLFERYMILFGSGLVVIKIIKNIENNIK